MLSPFRPGDAHGWEILTQLALEAALMELALQCEKQGTDEVGDNVRGALFVIGENAWHIKQGLAKLRTNRL
jgi:hypothetical protein